MTNHPLSKIQIASFQQDGYLLLENTISPVLLEKLNDQFVSWKLESSKYNESFGKQLDGRPRFSIEPGDGNTVPTLRRIASPQELSKTHLEVIRDNVALDAVAQLIGPSIKFNNAKINSKQPGTATKVNYHQDFMFEPHTNDDLITVLIFLDEVTPDNGPLNVIPGSHLGPLHSHWHDDVFTGAVSTDVEKNLKPKATPCFGSAGSACLMHTRLIHGSGPNLSSTARTLFIVTYSAEDAYPLQANHIPSIQAGEIVRGQSANKVRCSNYEMEFPEIPTHASFFEQQVRQS